MRVGLFTIASKNYLAYVRVLMDSVAKVHPEFERYLCLADRVDGAFDPKAESYEVVEAEAIGIPGFAGMSRRYDIMELNTAVKPFMFTHLFETTNLDAVIYLDPDIRAFGRFDTLLQRLEAGASMVLTPHVTRPLEDGKTPNDYHMLQTGVFNLGFAAATRCDESRDFLAWWGRHLERECVVDLPAGLFVDQKWCDLAPCLLEKLDVLRDTGYNVAYWNLPHRKVARDAQGQWQADGQPLRFFHFSGVSADRRQTISKHQDRLAWDDVPAVQPLFQEYFERLDAAGWQRTRQWKYAYGTLPGGLAMGSVLRLMYQALEAEDAIGPESMDSGTFVALCNRPDARVQQDGHTLVTRLMHFVYRLRPDVQSVFSLESAEGRAQFATWFAESAPREYGLPDSLARHAPAGGAAPAPGVSRDTPLAAWLNEFARKRVTVGDVDLPAFVNRLRPERAISNLMFMIWLARGDLQDAFDLRQEEGQEAFRNWCDVSLPGEYGIAPAAPEGHAGPERVGLFRRLLGAPKINGHDRSEVLQGASLVGYANAQMGMGEHVRMTAAAVATTDLPHGIVNFEAQGRGLSAGYKANVFHINADQMLPAFCRLGRDFFRGHYNIGYWAWELARCPDEWLPAIGLVDEIWAPSRFIQQAFAERTSIPVQYMPLCVALGEVTDPGRRALGLPEDRFLFLFVFDFRSYIERKNPFAAIRAFRKAFPRGDEKVGLVIKVMNGEETDPRWRHMQELIAEDARIIVRNEKMTREAVLGLQLSCDCFVSLHRSEGFGRGPAEAMALGKPVIVTNYSGNTDFTRADNACLVDYQLVPVEEGDYVFAHGQFWAEADVEHAAWHMRTVACDAQFRENLGARARHVIESEFGPAVIGANYRNRLRALGLA